MRVFVIFTVLLFWVSFAFSQVYQVGDSIADFSAIDVTKGKDFELNKNDENVIVLIFISNRCPFVDQYISRVVAMDSTYSSIQFVLVNTYSKAHLHENKHHMLAFLKRHKLHNSYIKRHELSEDFGIEKTPEVCLLVKVEESYHLAYKGAIDDNPQSEKDVKMAHLKQAIQKVLVNPKHTTPKQRSVGCRVN